MMLKSLPRGVWALGITSLFMDVSSEMIHALLPVYLVGAMGASMVAVGLIEGIAEATAQVVKVFSGALSDRTGKRKPLALVGYGLAALTKPVFPLAGSLGWIVAARFVDRVGKGIRGAPRDALVADLTPEDRRGAAYGLRQALDTLGAVIGPLIAVALMWLTADNIPAVFWAAVLPAGLAVFVLFAFVREPARGEAKPRTPLSRAAMAELGPVFWGVAGAATLFSLARFSEAFLVLEAAQEGLAVAFVPLVLIAMNLAGTLAAYPAGALSDKHGRVPVLAVGLGLLVVGDLAMALGPGLIGAFVGIVLWGLHLGMTQGAFSALVADAVPAKLRGTGFGVLNLGMGLATLLASVLAGLLWDVIGASATFLTGAGLAAATLVVLLPLARRVRRVRG